MIWLQKSDHVRNRPDCGDFTKRVGGDEDAQAGVDVVAHSRSWILGNEASSCRQSFPFRWKQTECFCVTLCFYFVIDADSIGAYDCCTESADHRASLEEPRWERCPKPHSLHQINFSFCSCLSSDTDKLWCQPISSPPAAALGLKWMQMIGQKGFNGFLLSCVHVWLAEETVSQRAVGVLVLKLWAWNMTLPAGPMMVCPPGEIWGTSWSRQRSCFLRPLLCRWLMWNVELFCALSNKLDHTLDSWAWLGLRGYLFKDLEGFNFACRKSHVNETCSSCILVFTKPEFVTSSSSGLCGVLCCVSGSSCRGTKTPLFFLCNACLMMAE